MGRDTTDIATTKQRAAEGQQIFAAIEDCVNNIQQNIVIFGRLVYLLIEDAELRKAAGWDSEDEMFADPLIKQGFEYVISLESEWQVYRLKRMLKLDAAMPEANILETQGWTGITQTSKIAELESLSEEKIDKEEKASIAASIILRPNKKEETEDIKAILFDTETNTVFVDGIPTMRFTTQDQAIIIRTLSRLLHVSDSFGVSGNKLVSRGKELKDVAEILSTDKEMFFWLTKRLRARKIIQ